MYSFPTPLFSTPQGMFNDQSISFGTGIQREIFYSVKNGNWSDVSVWETVSGRVGLLPTINDDVYIRPGTTVLANLSSSMNSLFISGTLILTSNTVLSISDTMYNTGVLDISTASGRINLNGTFNILGNLIGGGGATISYQSLDDCEIYPETSYDSLWLQNGTKYLNGDIILSGVLNRPNAMLNLRFYNFTSGTGVTDFTDFSTLRRWGIIKEYEGGSIIFRGTFIMASCVFKIASAVIDFRAGFDFYSGDYSLAGCQIMFTTNNQRFAVRQLFIPVTSLLIDNITVTNESITFSSSGFIINDQINGSTPTSTWINKGSIYFNTTTLPMVTGIFDYLTYPESELGYVMNSNYTLPYLAYQSLYIGGSGIKRFGGITSIGNNLSIAAGAALDVESYNLLVPGQTLIGGTLTRTGLGSNVFGGLLTIGGTLAISNLIEIRGGLTGGSVSALTVSNDITFTTNDQLLDGNNVNIGSTLTLSGNILISGAISVVAGTHLPTFTNILITNSLNGDNVSSKLVNKCAPSRGLHYRGSTQPMATGILDCSTNANAFYYNRTGNQEVKGTTYRTLEFGGSGVKKLMGNVVVNTTAGGSWSITGTATIDYNGFTITTI